MNPSSTTVKGRGLRVGSRNGGTGIAVAASSCAAITRFLAARDAYRAEPAAPRVPAATPAPVMARRNDPHAAPEPPDMVARLQAAAAGRHAAPVQARQKDVNGVPEPPDMAARFAARGGAR